MGRSRVSMVKTPGVFRSSRLARFLLKIAIHHTGDVKRNINF
jgi:hypothetical protein